MDSPSCSCYVYIQKLHQRQLYCNCSMYGRAFFFFFTDDTEWEKWAINKWQIEEMLSMLVNEDVYVLQHY
jgi:hypothetical protein